MPEVLGPSFMHCNSDSHEQAQV